jgi:hypothetical protein
MATPSSRTVEVMFNEAVCVYKADSQTEVIVGYESRTFGDGEIRRRESLTRLKTTAYTYLLRTKPSGERVVLRDPASVWVLSNGVDPSNGDTVEVKPAYVLAGSELLVRYTDAGEGKLEREIITGGEGDRIVYPEANQSIRKFDWDPASFGTFWSFNYVRVQTLELIVSDVFLLDEGIKCTYRLGLSYKWNGVHGIKQLLSQGGNDPTPLLVAAIRIDLTAQKGDGTGPWTELSRAAGWSGMELEWCVVLDKATSSTSSSLLAVLAFCCVYMRRSSAPEAPTKVDPEAGKTVVAPLKPPKVPIPKKAHLTAMKKSHGLL